MSKGNKARKFIAIVCVVAALALTAFFAASCGSSSTAKKSTGNTTTTKLPPGVTAATEGESSSTTSSSTSSSATQSTPAATTPAPAATTTSTPSATADLAGTRYTIVHATRPNTNKSVISSSGREVPGDYLEVELTAFNTGAAGLVDLSQYSFRLLSPGIAADTYTDYYGTVGTYGTYVAEHEISATLLSYSDLQPVAYKVKVGENITKVFVFFDLNPLTDAPNAGVTKDNSQFIVYKTAGTDSGTQVAMSLAGYPD
jgi:flagellar basal body-associated protein FliL